MIGEQAQHASPMRLLEMLADRFGAFEAVANSTIKLARYAPEDELSMDVQLAEAVLEFGNDLREAAAVAETWAGERLRGQPARFYMTRTGLPARPILSFGVSFYGESSVSSEPIKVGTWLPHRIVVLISVRVVAAQIKLSVAKLGKIIVFAGENILGIKVRWLTI